MDVVTVTLGRNRRPGSSIAPSTPLGDQEWDNFRAAVRQALTDTVVVTRSWLEQHGGIAFWEGVPEESHKIAALDCIADADLLAALRNRLSVLAASYDQDAIAVSVGTSDLVSARVGRAAIGAPVAA